MKRLIAVLAAAAVTAAAFLAIPAFGATRSVSVRDNVFSPRTLNARSGDTIRFVWRGDNPHNIRTTRRPRGASAITAPVKESGTYRKRLTRRGTYRLLCTIHAPSMRMTIRVR
jgi:plastocyanin